MGGQIAKLPVKEGQRVKKGDLLIELWNKDIMAELTLARSETKAAKARSTAACLQSEMAEREANRLKNFMKICAAFEEQIDKKLLRPRH